MWIPVTLKSNYKAVRQNRQEDSRSFMAQRSEKEAEGLETSGYHQMVHGCRDRSRWRQGSSGCWKEVDTARAWSHLPHGNF